MADQIPVDLEAWTQLEEHERKSYVRHADVRRTECHDIVESGSARRILEMWPQPFPQLHTSIAAPTSKKWKTNPEKTECAVDKKAN